METSTTAIVQSSQALNNATFSATFNSTSYHEQTTAYISNFNRVGIYIVGAIAGVLAIAFIIFISCYIRSVRRYEKLRDRILSLRRFDSNVDTVLTGKMVQTPDEPCTNDPLLTFQVNTGGHSTTNLDGTC